jgi:GNAT superfamily N-acetyltransferase
MRAVGTTGRERAAAYVPAPVANDASNRHTTVPVSQRRVVGASYAIALARSRDVPALPAIERAAARLLAGRVPPSILEEATEVEELAAAQAAGRLWVARADDVPVGFAHVVLLSDGTPHLEEIDVDPHHGRRGLGAALVEAVCDWVERERHPGITLTTFRDVPWNLPFYARMGFVVVPTEAVTPAVAAIVRDETARGLDPERRVVMAYVARPGCR